MQTVNVPKHNFYPRSAIWMQDQYMLHRSRNSGREFPGWNQLPCGPVLTPNLLYKAQDPFSACRSPIVPKHVLNLVPENLDVGPFYASQIKKPKKRICWVSPTPFVCSETNSSIKNSRSIQCMQAAQILTSFDFNQWEERKKLRSPVMSTYLRDTGCMCKGTDPYQLIQDEPEKFVSSS